MSARDGGSAFPNDGSWANGHPEGGMSLRDYFAGQALVGFLIGSGSAGWAIPSEHQNKMLAANAYATADFMLVQRAKATP